MDMRRETFGKMYFFFVYEKETKIMGEQRIMTTCDPIMTT